MAALKFLVVKGDSGILYRLVVVLIAWPGHPLFSEVLKPDAEERAVIIPYLLRTPQTFDPGPKRWVLRQGNIPQDLPRYTSRFALNQEPVGECVCHQVKTVPLYPFPGG